MSLTPVITTVILVARCTNMVQQLCVVSYLHSKVLKVRMVLDNKDSNYGICLMFRYESYKKTPRVSACSVNQPLLASLVVSAKSESSYDHGHPKRLTLCKSVVEDLIVGCGLRLAIVENPHFRHF